MLLFIAVAVVSAFVAGFAVGRGTAPAYVAPWERTKPLTLTPRLPRDQLPQNRRRP